MTFDRLVTSTKHGTMTFTAHPVENHEIHNVVTSLQSTYD